MPRPNFSRAPCGLVKAAGRARTRLMFGRRERSLGMPLCTEKQARAAVYILTPNTHICIREASSQKLGRAWEVGTMPNTGKCILGNRLSLVVHNGGI